MVTTVSVSSKRQVVLPKAFCERKKIKAGTSLRVVEIAEGLYVSPVSEPSVKEMNEVVAAAGTFDRPASAAEEQLLKTAISAYRKRRNKR